MAWLCDALIKFVIVFVGLVILSLMGDFGAGIRFIMLFLIFWVYNVAFELLMDGATPGKRWQGIRVVSANGTPVTFGGSVLRNLVRAVDALPVTYAFGCLAMLLTSKSQRLGDLAAETLVIYQSDKPSPTRAASRHAPMALPIPLTIDEQQAIVTFSERSATLAEDRQRELAEILEPVFGSVTAADLHAYASWLAGGDERS